KADAICPFRMCRILKIRSRPRMKSACPLKTCRCKVVFRQPGAEAVVLPYELRFLAILMVQHFKFTRSPDTFEIIVIAADGEGFQQRVFAVVIVDLAEQIVARIDPDDLTCIARTFIGGHALHDMTLALAARLIAQPAIGELANLLRG